MASVQILPKVGENDRREWKITDAVTDADVGKPVTISGVATVSLCADGDLIHGFVDSIEQGTDGGLIVVTVVEKGTVRATASGAVAVGDVVDAHTQTAAGTVPVAWGLVSTIAVPVAGQKYWVALTAGTDANIIIQAV